MVYSETEIYYEHCQPSTMECFAKKFLRIWNMELSDSSIEKCFIFSWKKYFLMFHKRNFLLFQSTETLKELFIFSQKKAFLILQEMETSTTTRKMSLYFRKFFIFHEVTYKAKKSNFFYTFYYREEKVSKLTIILIFL